MKARDWFPVSLLALLLAGVIPAVPAQATDPVVEHFSLLPNTSQAGAHPDVEYSFLHSAHAGCEPVCEARRRLSIHWPTGFIGNPHVAAQCRLAEFAVGNCPVDAQVGIFISTTFHVFFPLYNMETRPDQAGMVGVREPVTGSPIFLDLSGRTDSDYGLDAISSPLVRIETLSESSGVFWGVPADPVHNPQRFQTPLGVGGACGTQQLDAEGGCKATHAQPTLPPAPFLQNPTTCGVPLQSSAGVEYYGGAFASAEAPWPATIGCQQLGFNPSQSVRATTTQADTASGIDAGLVVPQAQSPSAPAQSEIKTNRVVLPEGFSINPGAADGKTACLDGQTSIGTLFAAQCPEFAKVGTTEVRVAALPGTIFGGLYLGEPKPGEPYRLILTADGFATHVKLLGEVSADPLTGRLTTTFEQPQTNLEEVNLHFFGSERALLATPERCGDYPVENEFVPWDSELATRRSTTYITIDSGPGAKPCPAGPRPFSPSLAAGSANPTAGFHSPFSFALTRDDGDQNLAGLDVTLPPGFSATLKGIPYCPDSAIAQLSAPAYSGRTEQASPLCAASRIGTVTAGAGAGTHPLYVSGGAYLAGPYKGAPLSLVAVIPAVSGPYDLGNVAVRAAIEVNPVTARVRVVSDPLPQIVEGIPLRTRSIQVDLDRPEFALNPTSCEPFSIDAAVFGDEGATAVSSSHFQVANCDELPYRPQLALKLSGGLKRRGHPAIDATFTAKPGEANTRLVQVALPQGELLDNAHIRTICTRPDFAKDNCPAGSLIGTAEATLPILDQPLKGNVYLRSSSHELPDLVVDLEGQFEAELAGRVDTAKTGGLRTTFETVPDVPVSSFVLHLAGGSKGLLQNSESLCGAPKRAIVKMIGQNGTALGRKLKLQVACGSKARHKRHQHSTPQKKDRH